MSAKVVPIGQVAISLLDGSSQAQYTMCPVGSRIPDLLYTAPQVDIRGTIQIFKSDLPNMVYLSTSVTERLLVAIRDQYPQLSRLVVFMDNRNIKAHAISVSVIFMAGIESEAKLVEYATKNETTARAWLYAAYVFPVRDAGCCQTCSMVEDALSDNPVWAPEFAFARCMGFPSIRNTRIACLRCSQEYPDGCDGYRGDYGTVERRLEFYKHCK